MDNSGSQNLKCETQAPLTEPPCSTDDQPSAASEPVQARDMPNDGVAPSPMSFFERVMCANEAFPADVNAPAWGMVINGALYFRRLPAREAIVETLSTTLLRHMRFRSVGRPDDGSWEPVAVDMDYHCVQESPVSSEAGMREAIESIMMQNLDPQQPLWRAHLLPTTDTNASSVMLLRVHHCIGDGMAIGQIFDCLVQPADGQAKEENPLLQKFAEERARQRAGNACARACRGAAIGVDSVKSFASVSSIPFRRMETDTSFMKPRANRKQPTYGERRSVVFVPAHSLEYVKALKNAAHVSLNDIVLAATTGALRRYCKQNGDSVFDEKRWVRSRALLPVCLPPTDAASKPDGDNVHNNFAFISCRLAMSEETPTERLKKTTSEMNGIKRSTKAFVSLWQTNKMLPKVMPKAMIQKTARDVYANHSMIFSNFPGPAQPVTIAGEPVVGVQAMFANLIPQTIIVSYSGKLFMNMVVDPDVVKDPDLVATCYLAELQALGEALGVNGSPLA